MTLNEAIDSIAALTTPAKASGHLIRHDEWNGLLAALGAFGASLSAQQAALAGLDVRVATLESEMATVQTDAEALADRVDGLEARVAPLLDNYLVTLSCAKQHYAMGEVCEITARVTDLLGAPPPAPYPWVDFMTAWGRLRAKAGFTSRDGGDDNSLSVRVDAQGIARVEVRAEHSQGFSEAQESQIGDMMRMQVPAQGGKTVVEAFMSAPAPGDASAKAAYKVMSAAYDQKDATVFKDFADSYHVAAANKYGAAKYEVAAPAYQANWRDYRATVIALAKPDADPVSADGTRGLASIQVVFRDWLYHWGQDYLGDLLQLENELVPVFTGIIKDSAKENLLDKLKHKVDELLPDRGLLGGEKMLNVVLHGMGRVDPGPDLDKVDIKAQFQDALAAQTTLPGAGTAVMRAYLGQGARTGGLKQQVAQVATQLVETKGIQASVSVLEGRMQAAEQVGMSLHSSLTLINDNVRAINPLDENSLKANVQKISADIALLKSRVG